MRTMPWLRSAISATWSRSYGWKKLGQPVPDSNFAFEANSGSPHSRQV
jgi:hypothetical protein